MACYEQTNEFKDIETTVKTICLRKSISMKATQPAYTGHEILKANLAKFRKK